MRISLGTGQIKMLNFLATIFMFTVCKTEMHEGKILTVIQAESGWRGTAVMEGGFVKRYTLPTEPKVGDIIQLGELKCK